MSDPYDDWDGGLDVDLYVKSLRENILDVECASTDCSKRISEWDRDTRKGICSDCFWTRTEYPSSDSSTDLF